MIIWYNMNVCKAAGILSYGETGNEEEVKVLGEDPKKKRISLTIKGL